MDLLGWLLVLGATLRLSRLVIVDDLGKWWLQDRIDRAMDRYADKEIVAANLEDRLPRDPWWWKYRAGLWCPFCVGFWIAVGVVLSYLFWGDTLVWKVIAAMLTLNYVAAHLGARLGDVRDDDE